MVLNQKYEMSKTAIQAIPAPKLINPCLILVLRSSAEIAFFSKSTDVSLAYSCSLGIFLPVSLISIA
jgi:hypothetical protein